MANEQFSRFLPCEILGDCNIPCVIWCEDAIGYYGVPTVVFDVYILVIDIDKAAGVLMQRGWHLENGVQTNFGNDSLPSDHRRMIPPDSVIQITPPWSPKDGPPFMLAIVSFADEGGKTRYEARIRHWTPEARVQHQKMGFERGWGQCADQLEALARTL